MRYRVAMLIVGVILFTACAASGPSVNSTPISVTILSLTKTPGPTYFPTHAPVANVDQVTNTIIAGYEISGGAFGFGSLWLLAPSSGILRRMDATKDTVVATIKTTGTPDKSYGDPTAAVVSADSVWVDSVSTHELLRIDPATNSIAQRVSIGKVEVGGNQIAFSPMAMALDGDTLWASDFTAGAIVRVDLKAGRAVAVIQDVPNVVSIVSGAGAIWALEHRLGVVARIDPQTNSVVARIQLPGKAPDPTSACGACWNGIAFGDGGVWTGNGLGQSVSRIDPQTNQVVATVDLGEVVGDVSAGAGAVWAAARPDGCVSGKGFVARIDPQTAIIKSKLPVSCPQHVLVGSDAVWVTGGSGSAPEITRIQPGS